MRAASLLQQQLRFGVTSMSAAKGMPVRTEPSMTQTVIINMRVLIESPHRSDILSDLLPTSTCLHWYVMASSLLTSQMPDHLLHAQGERQNHSPSTTSCQVNKA